MVVPSGENSGCESLAGWVVSWRASPPPELTTQRSPFHSKATSAPSGDKAGYFASRMGSAAVSGAAMKSARHNVESREITISLRQYCGQASRLTLRRYHLAFPIL